MPVKDRLWFKARIVQLAHQFRASVLSSIWAMDTRAASWLLEGEKEPVSDFTLKKGSKGARAGDSELARKWRTGSFLPSKPLDSLAPKMATWRLSVQEHQVAITGRISETQKYIVAELPICNFLVRPLRLPE